MHDQNRSFGAVLVGGRHIDEDLPRFAHLLLLRLERLVVTPENFAFSQGHREFEVLAFWIAFVGKIGVRFIIGANCETPIPLLAGIFSVFRGSPPGMGSESNDSNGEKRERAY